MSDAPALFGFRPVPAPGGGTRLEFGPLPAPKAGGKGKKARPAPDPIKANPDASAQQLRQLIERYERLEEEKAGIIIDQADVLSEAKAVGFDTRTLRKIVALRKLDKNDRLEAEAILETYLAALGID